MPSAPLTPRCAVQVLATRRSSLLVVAGAVLTDPVTPERARLAASSTAGQHAFRHVHHRRRLRGRHQRGHPRLRRLADDQPAAWARSTPPGRSWAWSRWTSGWVSPATLHPADPELERRRPPRTPPCRSRPGCGRTTGEVSTFKVVGAWSTRDDLFRRTSAGTPARRRSPGVNTDTLVGGLGRRPQRLPAARAAAARPRQHGHPDRPSPAGRGQPTGDGARRRRARRCTAARTLAVPRYSQMTHRGQYPQYGGGGEAWCSPTSLSMILGYYKRAADARPTTPGSASRTPTRGSTTSPGSSTTTATAAPATGPSTRPTPPPSTGNAFVTRLPSLREAERFIHAGIPLAASISFGRGGLDRRPDQLDGRAPRGDLRLHRAGNVVVNDPAAPDATPRSVASTTAASSSGPGRPSPPAPSTSSATRPIPSPRGPAARSW